MVATWRSDEITFEIDAESDHPVAFVAVTTPQGLIEILTEFQTRDITLVLVRFSVQSDFGPNGLGVARLRQIADAAMERFDYDALEIEGTARTTGAGPGRIPKRLRFARRRRVAPRS